MGEMGGFVLLPLAWFVMSVIGVIVLTIAGLAILPVVHLAVTGIQQRSRRRLLGVALVVATILFLAVQFGHIHQGPTETIYEKPDGQRYSVIYEEIPYPVLERNQ